MNKYLSPPTGLWHLGEQCGIDLYKDVETGEFLEIDVIENGLWYTIGMFQGKSLDHAKNQLYIHSKEYKPLCGWGLEIDIPEGEIIKAREKFAK